MKKLPETRIFFLGLCMHFGKYCLECSQPHWFHFSEPVGNVHAKSAPLGQPPMQKVPCRGQHHEKPAPPGKPKLQKGQPLCKICHSWGNLHAKSALLEGNLHAKFAAQDWDNLYAKSALTGGKKCPTWGNLYTKFAPPGEPMSQKSVPPRATPSQKVPSLGQPPRKIFPFLGTHV